MRTDLIDAWFFITAATCFSNPNDFGNALQVDQSAYVHDGYIVMELSSEPLSLYMGQGAAIQITLAGGTLQAKLSTDGTRIESGVFGGRMIENVQPVFGAVAAAAVEQNSTTSELARNAGVSSQFVNAVADGVVEIEQAAAAARGFRVEGYFFDVPVKEALARNAVRAGAARIPVPGVLRTAKILERPSHSEGFDALFRVTVNAGSFDVTTLTESSPAEGSAADEGQPDVRG